MKSQMLMVAGAAMVVAMTACAKTVALWPIECDPTSGTLDGSSAVADGDTLTTHGDATISGGVGADWMLPPNPDTSPLLYEPRNTTAVFGSLGETVAANGMTLKCTSANVVNHLYPLQDFTLEGWFRCTELKSDNWTIFLQQSEGSTAGKGGWFISFLGLGSSGSCRFHLCAAISATSNKEQDFTWLTADEESDLTARWHHFALTFEYDDGNGNSVWTCYLDGVNKGMVTHAKMNAGTALGARQFFMGGRNASASNRFCGGFDYWRLSDSVLTPDEFLDNGGSGAPHPVHTTSTVAYWKLERRADGSLDVSDSVGSADFSDGFYDVVSSSADFFPGILPSAEQAFVGDPPNPTAALLSPNSGSFRSPNKSGNSDVAKNGTVLVVPNLGKELTYANDFTVEGWLKPDWRTGQSQGGFLLGTRNSSEIGWNMRVTSNGDLWLFANDGGSGDVRPDAKIATLPSSWKDAWTHVALVYASTVGNGTWTFYANGEKLGSLENTRTAASGRCSAFFRLGGRENTDSNLAANYDCWRVSKAALAPEQFLCAKNGTAAENVVAYWPFDIVNGFAWDLHDERGNYTIRPVRSTGYWPVSASDAPTVSNPDTTAAFNGSSSDNAGSADFRAPDGTRSRANLATSDNRLLAAISSIDGFTIEGYVKLTAAPAGSEYVLLTKAGSFSTSEWSDHQIALLYGSSGFSIIDKKFSNFGNGVSGAFGEKSVLPVGEWHHVALAYRGEESKNANDQTVLTSYWTLSVDGKEANTLSRSTLGAVSSVNPRWFLLGARPHTNDGLVGQLDSWRVSSKVLEPGEFLCAAGTRPVATPVITRAYWPLDADGATIDAASKVEPAGYTLDRLNADEVTGSSDRAKDKLPLDTEELPPENVGSVRISGKSRSYLRSVWLGRRLALDKAFTIEGWVKCDASVRGKVQLICGTIADYGNGWALLLDDTGAAPQLRVIARCGNACTRSVDAAFARSLPVSKLGRWFHLSLAYDPQTGRGTWCLLVNGRNYGTVENLWRNDSFDSTTDTFYLGSYNKEMESLAGGYDMWRVSSGLVPLADLLWQKDAGLFIIGR